VVNLKHFLQDRINELCKAWNDGKGIGNKSYRKSLGEMIELNAMLYKTIFKQAPVIKFNPDGDRQELH
jgi:hypothetical protein